MAKELNLHSDILNSQEKSKASEMETPPAPEQHPEKGGVTPNKKDSVRTKLAHVKTKIYRTLFEGDRKYTSISGLAFILAAILLIVTLFIQNTPLNLPEDLTTLPEARVSATIAQDHLLTQEPSEPLVAPNPLNGTLMTESDLTNLKKSSPVSVMVNNHVYARPQSNLYQADIVFESVAESGITRLMPIYWQNRPEIVGPIRSVRQYHLEFMSPYDPIFIHDGFASADDPRVDAVTNMYAYGIKTISTTGAWRSPMLGRVAPHNEYSSIVTAQEYGQQNGLNNFKVTADPNTYKPDAPLETPVANLFTIVFSKSMNNYGQYDVTWAYDKGTNSYKRSNGGEAQVDPEAKVPVSAKNIVIIKTNVTPTYNYKGHMIIEATGSGDVEVWRDGDVIKGRWEKADRTSRYKLTDTDGAPLELNRGVIWYSVVDKSDADLIY